MNYEQLVLDAVERGKALGYAEGMRASKEKTLTDEEIIEIWSGMETDTGEQNIIFARAILRKAQEK